MTEDQDKDSRTSGIALLPIILVGIGIVGVAITQAVPAIQYVWRAVIAALD